MYQSDFDKVLIEDGNGNQIEQNSDIQENGGHF